METFEQVPNVGIAGSKLLFPDGKLQEAGGIIWRLGDGWNWGRGRDPNEPAFSFLRDADWVSGAALMIERTLFDELGGFDESYAPAYYEDTDLAFRVRALGKRVVMQPASEIVHLEGVSAGTDTSGPGMKRFQVINHAKFYRRWKDTLITHRFNGQQPEQEAERLVTRRAYFIDDTVPTPDQDAGSNAAVEHMRALMELGYKVTFLPADNMAKIDPYTGRLAKARHRVPVSPVSSGRSRRCFARPPSSRTSCICTAIPTRANTRRWCGAISRSAGSSTTWPTCTSCAWNGRRRSSPDSLSAAEPATAAAR